MSVGCERTKEIKDEPMALVWANKGGVAFNWNGNSCRRSGLKEEDQDIDLGALSLRCLLRVQEFKLKIGDKAAM